MSKEPANLVLETLQKIRSDIARVDEKVDILRADVASDFIGVNAKMETLRKETSEQIVGLRRAVIKYHSTVLGHGVLIRTSRRGCGGWSSGLGELAPALEQGSATPHRK